MMKFSPQRLSCIVKAEVRPGHIAMPHGLVIWPWGRQEQAVPGKAMPGTIRQGQAHAWLMLGMG